MKNTIQTSRVARRTVTAFIIMACCLFTLASTQAGDRDDRDGKESKFLLISFDEFFTGGPNIDGTTTMAGAFSDKGPRHQNNTVVSVSSDGTQVVVTGTVRITGAKGTLTTSYTGTIQLDATNIAYIEGTEFITGGTGTYANAKGKGTFEATIDFDTNNIVGVAELKVKSQK